MMFVPKQTASVSKCVKRGGGEERWWSGESRGLRLSSSIRWGIHLAVDRLHLKMRPGLFLFFTPKQKSYIIPKSCIEPNVSGPMKGQQGKKKIKHSQSHTVPICTRRTSSFQSVAALRPCAMGSDSYRGPSHRIV